MAHRYHCPPWFQVDRSKRLRQLQYKELTKSIVPRLSPLSLGSGSCLFSPALCLPSPALPPYVPLSSSLPHSLLSFMCMMEQGLTAIHHLAPSSCLQSR